MFTLSNGFEHSARQVARTMTGNVADIPDSDGMKLVRCGTTEAAEREADSGVLAIPMMIDDKPYLICSR